MFKKIVNFIKGKLSLKCPNCICAKTSKNIQNDFLNPFIKDLNHVAIIADGNRRWARQKGLSSLEGHRKGFIEVAPQVCGELWDWGVHTVTIWCLSTGNWNRDLAEVENLLYVAEELIAIMLPIAQKMQGRIVHLGRKDRLPLSLVNALKEAEESTAFFKEHTFNIGIDYSGVDEVVRACQKIIAQGVPSNLLAEKLFDEALDTANQLYPMPDLVIRSAGEQRLSGFMMWQTVYSELYFTTKYFPDFSSEVLREAIFDFGRRARTFSK